MYGDGIPARVTRPSFRWAFLLQFFLAIGRLGQHKRDEPLRALSIPPTDDILERKRDDTTMTDKTPTAAPLPTLTLASFCDLLRPLADGNARVASCSRATAGKAIFSFDEAEVYQDEDWNASVPTTSISPSAFDGCNMVIFDSEPIEARAFLDAVEPCLERHGHVRVCVDGKRAIDVAPIVSVVTDQLSFAEGPDVVVDAATTRKAVDITRELAALAVVDVDVLARTVAQLVPCEWEAELFLVGSALMEPDAFYGAFPDIADGDVDKLFVVAGASDKPAPPPQGALARNATAPARGRVTLRVARPGITHAMLSDAYGPSKKTAAESILAAAAANNASAAV